MKYTKTNIQFVCLEYSEYDEDCCVIALVLHIDSDCNSGACAPAVKLRQNLSAALKRFGWRPLLKETWLNEN